jgi:hypothetical protein
MGQQEGKFDTAETRWAGVGPYYAMFPAVFADRVVRKYTSKGDLVLDPFAGRGTAVFSAAAQGRLGVGVELNPVGWVYARAKLATASREAVEARLRQIGSEAAGHQDAAAALPPFFHACFSNPVLQFLLAARHELDWRHRRVDWTTMALLLVNLHGKHDASLSNQMRQTKSLAPDYAVRWWAERGMTPPSLDPVEFMVGKLRWRYARGTPPSGGSRVYLGDSTKRLNPLAAELHAAGLPKGKLLLTSPPYCGVTNYHYDQWLRLWMLGGPPHPKPWGARHRGKFYDKTHYRELLRKVFSGSARVLARDAVVYVRTDRREPTLTMTADVLREVFPHKRLYRRYRPFERPTQTHLFGDRSQKVGEVDLVLM